MWEKGVTFGPKVYTFYSIINTCFVVNDDSHKSVFICGTTDINKGSIVSQWRPSNFRRMICWLISFLVKTTFYQGNMFGNERSTVHHLWNKYSIYRFHLHKYVKLTIGKVKCFHFVVKLIFTTIIINFQMKFKIWRRLNYMYLGYPLFLFLWKNTSIITD